MDRCTSCGQELLEDVLVDDSAEVAGHTFRAELPGDRCRGCGAIAIQGKHTRAFELCIASELAKAGARDGAALAYLRRVLGLSVSAAAQLCSVDAELVELWEAGRCQASARAAGLLAAVVLSTAGAGGEALDPLRLLRAPRALPPTVRLSLQPGRSRAAREVANAMAQVPARA